MPTPNELLAKYTTQSQMSSFFMDKMGILNLLSYSNGLSIYDGSTSAYNALVNAISDVNDSGGVIYIPTTPDGSTYILDLDITIPAKVTLWFANGAKFKTSNNAVITLNCAISAELHQIFEGQVTRNTLLSDTLVTDNNSDNVPDNWTYSSTAVSSSSSVNALTGTYLELTTTDTRFQAVNITYNTKLSVSPNELYFLKIDCKFTKTSGQPYLAYSVKYYDSSNNYITIRSNYISRLNLADYTTQYINFTVPSDSNISKAELKIYIQTGAVDGAESGYAYLKNLELYNFEYSIVGKPKIEVGFPEWFGAVVDNTNVNSTDAINIALNLTPKVQLNDGTYYVSEVLLKNYNNLTGKGVTSVLKKIVGTEGNAVLNTTPGCLSFEVNYLLIDGTYQDCHGFQQSAFLSTSGDAGLERQFSFVYIPKLKSVSVINCLRNGFNCLTYTKVNMNDCQARDVSGYGFWHRDANDSIFQDCAAFITGLAAFYFGKDDRVLNFKCFHTNQDTTATDNMYAIILQSTNYFTGYIEEVPYGAIKIIDSSNYIDCFLTNVGTNYIFKTTTSSPQTKSLIMLGAGGSSWKRCMSNYLNINWAMDILDAYPVKPEYLVEVLDPNIFNNEIYIRRWKSPATQNMAIDLKDDGSLHPENIFIVNGVDVTKTFSDYSGNIYLSNYVEGDLTYPITRTVVKEKNKYTINITDGLEEQPKNYGLWTSRNILLDFNILADVLAGNINYMHIEVEAQHGLSNNQAKCSIDLQLRDVTNNKTLLQFATIDTNKTSSKTKVYASDTSIFTKMRDYNATLVAEGGTYQLNLRFTFHAVSDQSITDSTATVTFENAKIWFG